MHVASARASGYTQHPLNPYSCGRSHAHRDRPHINQQALTSQLPKSAELRQVLDVSLSAPVQQLSSVVQQASQTALQATAVINKGGVQALAGLLERLTGLMQQGQMQVRCLNRVHVWLGGAGGAPTRAKLCCATS